MRTVSRRDWFGSAAALIATPALASRRRSTVRGVEIGIQSNSYSDRPLDAAIAAMVETGFSECELWQGHVEPRTPDPRKWRDEAPDSYFHGIALKFRKARIRIDAYDFSFRPEFADEEIERGILMAKALGVKCMVTSSATIALARRIAPYTEKHRMTIGMHGRTNVTDPNEFGAPASFEKALEFSPYVAINLDIGHFTAAGFDAIPFIEKHHARIVSIHLKDRKRNAGPSMPFGQGDSPVRECLRLLQKNGWNIPAHIEHDRGGDRVAEVKKAYEFCKQALA